MAGIFIAYESVSRIIYQKPVGEIGIGVVVMIVSVIVTGWLVGYLESVAKKTKSIVIASDALHYKTDLRFSWDLYWLHGSDGIILMRLLVLELRFISRFPRLIS